MVSIMKMVDTKTGTLRAGSADGVRVNRTGRRTYAPDYKLAVVSQCSEPGVSVAAIAMARGINANLVRRWIVRHRRALIDRTPKPQAMLPVAIDAATPLPEGRTDHQADAAATRRRQPAAATIEIELYGARIHLRGGVDAQALRDVLDVLSRR
jgi:transposase